LANEKIIPINIEEELKNCYLDYSMSVIVARALPDIRDGLKPVHRRILYGMYELGMQYNKPFKKSARIVGDVLGKYHPHGDSSVYMAMARLAQNFAMRYLIVDGQGNFGSIDGDSPAAMRYTEARMSRLADEILADIDKETVDFVPNFDDSLEEPTVMPSKIPYLLINGATGIAVGMATNIPPHNINEICNAVCATVENPEITTKELMQHVKGPDFPTGALAYGTAGLFSAYESGHGKITLRARANVEQIRSNREQIVFTEIPYQINKSNLVERIAELVHNKVLDGISDLRDESDKEGIRVVVELKRDFEPQVVLNNLYKHTNLQNTFGINMIALVEGIPKVLSLKSMLQLFVDYRYKIIVRRTQFELRKAEARAHLLEGFKIALDNIDEVIEIIKKSASANSARTNLMKRFEFSELQAQAILDMKLQRLTGLEREKVIQEYIDILKQVEKLKYILDNRDKQKAILIEETREIQERYGDERRTEMVADAGDFSVEDMIADEEMAITITHNGFIKRTPVNVYHAQRRGGVGKKGATAKEDDFIENLFIASTHDHLMFFTNLGKVYWLKVHELPQAGRATRGRAIVNLLECEKDEKVRAFLNVRDFNEDKYVIVSTKNGTIKKTKLDAYSRPRRTGIIAVNLQDGDDIVGVDITNGEQDIILGTRKGKAIRFNETHVRDMGRSATGVRGVTLDGKDDAVVDMVVVKREGATVLAVSENGYGKRSDIMDYRITNRGGKGVITIKTTDKVGQMVALKEVVDTDDLMIITTGGLLIRQHINRINTLSRNTQGVRLINLHDQDRISAIRYVMEADEKEDELQEMISE